VGRFLALAIPLALIALVAVDAGATALGWAPDLGPLAARGVARPIALPVTIGTLGVLFEAVALVALFLLIEGRSGSPLFDGVAAGLAAWLFRGPLLVFTIASMTRLPTAPFWQAARVGLVALPVAGAALGWLAGRRKLLS
jgi:hypothetical protein